MSEIETPEEKAEIWCEGHEQWIHSVEEVGEDGTCDECGFIIFEPLFLEEE